MVPHIIPTNFIPATLFMYVKSSSYFLALKFTEVRFLILTVKNNDEEIYIRSL